LFLRIGTRAPLLILGSLILMVNTNKALAVEMAPLFLVTLVVIVFLVSKLGPMFLVVQANLDNLNTVLQENISGIRVVKAFVRELFEGQRFEKTNQEFTGQNIKVMQYMAFLSPSMMILVNTGIVLVIWAGGLKVISGDLTIGEIVAFTNYLLTSISPLLILANISTFLANSFASAERINGMLEVIPEVRDQPQAISLPLIAQGQVIFEHVGFHYNGTSDEPVLHDINLVANPGEMIAILGATGAGKSTLVNLIPRFYEVSKGRVTLDGIDIREIQQDSLLGQVGVALQETVLFSGSVRDNIRYGQPSFPDDAVIEAAKAAQAHEFIIELPEGYDTHIEARGVNLSGGQKQRIAIARALLIRPKILILDDSTSAVDVETEVKIQDALNKWMMNRTSFIVAQRISTVLNADKIIVIDKGRIAAEGTHAELLKTSLIYQEIYESQLGDGFNIN
jgi:ATP-binding cassette subfamily B multidrug efflux pump